MRGAAMGTLLTEPVRKNILVPLTGLKAYCEPRDFMGWDPYDGLNSRVFKAMPLVGQSALCRLVWIQLFKRNPLNLRRLLLVPPQHNAKGIGLFLQGYCELHKIVKSHPDLAQSLGNLVDIEKQITHLAETLIKLRAPGFSGAAWGYNFPWQCRREFLFPAGEPTVVATNFCAWALLDAAEIMDNGRWREIAVSAGNFVHDDLRRTPHKGGVIISYSRMPGNDTIYNASLLGSRLLARIARLTGRDDYMRLARQSVVACCADQRQDGSWTYGVKSVTGWIDSFHTGYNLDGIMDYSLQSGDHDFDENIRRGLDYYLANFFEDNGAPKYYHDRQYPIDIHCPGQLVMTLVRLGRYDAHRELVHKVLEWTYAHMYTPRGYYFYQLKKGISSKIPYMRWSNAFMFCALATALGAELSSEKHHELSDSALHTRT